MEREREQSGINTPDRLRQTDRETDRSNTQEDTEKVMSM